MNIRHLIVASALSLAALPAAAADLSCSLSFSMTGWSAIYKHSTGTGTVRCSNGQTLPVKIEAKGGGLTFGKSRIDNGTGRFAGVRSIRDVLGGYATGEANAAAGKAAKAQVVTKGPVSLALAGKGEGVELGISFGSFIISER
ncbi:hypothetical protein GCM10008101_17430 [Lysobacter xinjiangensis]|uniref:Secreted protein n=2 Tax=Cognatilysobacter xinjiangensis TaxID=546892 RepID=A0ABQ3C142_9GAMM|nr:hypothetical protein [Lysobacter xinjiangensis]GGZ64323.1 hypothetical protein GCM10008101_17430 [Lysobacter xinjiangensis]